MRSIVALVVVMFSVVVTLAGLFSPPEPDAVPTELADSSLFAPNPTVSTSLPDPQPDFQLAATQPVLVTTDTPILVRADDIRSLPLMQQQEIHQLSGRDPSSNSIIEVRPGVFLMANGPRVVPVAVMNADGTVSIHEY